MSRRSLGERLLYFALVPAIVLAVLVLGGIALRTTLQVEKARQQTVFHATLTLADERVDRLDKLIVAQDNVAIAHAEPSSLADIPRRWLPTAARETPTIRAIVALDLDVPEHDVLAFVSRTPPARAHEDDAFRRLLVGRLFPLLELGAPAGELRHLHHVADRQSLLISYWQRTHAGRRFLMVAWHDVPLLVHDVMPRLYRDVDRGNGRMNVIDEDGEIVFGPPIKVGEFTVGRPFPTTLYNWRLQVALTTAEELTLKAERQRILEILMVGFSAAVALAGVAIVVVASLGERRLAALKSDFVANVSHELKTPLSLIRMFGEMLLAGRIPNDDKRRQYLQIIVGESERLTALIENVLDFAKVERGKVAYEFADGDVGEVAARAVEVYRYRAERENVELRSAIEQPLPVARIDARALELAVINLVDNALKYAKDGGLVEVHVAHEDRAVTVRVSDRGPGIDPDEQDRIFERFVRGRSAGESRVRGSGIGLALVKHIAEAHGGNVRVTSPITPDGKGSSFVLSIPARGERRATAAPARGADLDTPEAMQRLRRVTMTGSAERPAGDGDRRGDDAGLGPTPPD